MLVKINSALQSKISFISKNLQNSYSVRNGKGNGKGKDIIIVILFPVLLT